MPDGGVEPLAGAVPSDISKDAGVVFSRRSSSALPRPTAGVTTPLVLLAPLARSTAHLRRGRVSYTTPRHRRVDGVRKDTVAHATSIFAVPR